MPQVFPPPAFPPMHSAPGYAFPGMFAGQPFPGLTYGYDPAFAPSFAELMPFHPQHQPPMHPSLAQQQQPQPKRPRAKRKGPKKPLSAFMFFCAEHRAAMAKQHPESKFAEIGRFLGEAWRHLPPERKEPYAKMNFQDRQRYSLDIQDLSDVSDDSSSDMPERKERKKRVRREGPKRALSAYMYFAKETRPQLRHQYPDASFADVARMLGERWAAMGPEEKQPFEVKCATDKSRFLLEKEAMRVRQQQQQQQQQQLLGPPPHAGLPLPHPHMAAAGELPGPPLGADPAYMFGFDAAGPFLPPGMEHAEQVGFEHAMHARMHAAEAMHPMHPAAMHPAAMQHAAMQHAHGPHAFARYGMAPPRHPAGLAAHPHAWAPPLDGLPLDGLPHPLAPPAREDAPTEAHAAPVHTHAHAHAPAHSEEQGLPASDAAAGSAAGPPPLLPPDATGHTPPPPAGPATARGGDGPGVAPADGEDEAGDMAGAAPSLAALVSSLAAGVQRSPPPVAAAEPAATQSSASSSAATSGPVAAAPAPLPAPAAPPAVAEAHGPAETMPLPLPMPMPHAPLPLADAHGAYMPHGLYPTAHPGAHWRGHPAPALPAGAMHDPRMPMHLAPQPFFAYPGPAGRGAAERGLPSAFPGEPYLPTGSLGAPPHLTGAPHPSDDATVSHDLIPHPAKQDDGSTAR